MPESLLLVAVWVSAYLGFAFLAMSQHRNLRLVTGDRGAENCRVSGYQIAGAVLLFANLLVCIARDGPSFGAVLWAVVISVAATAVALTLTFRPHWLQWMSHWACPRQK